jgi:hypothetical protein
LESFERNVTPRLVQDHVGLASSLINGNTMDNYQGGRRSDSSK